MNKIHSWTGLLLLSIGLGSGKWDPLEEPQKNQFSLPESFRTKVYCSRNCTNMAADENISIVKYPDLFKEWREYKIKGYVDK